MYHSYDRHLLRKNINRNWYFFYKWVLPFLVGLYLTWLLTRFIPARLAAAYSIRIPSDVSFLSAAILLPFMLWFCYRYTAHRLAVLCTGMARGWGIFNLFVVLFIIVIISPVLSVYRLFDILFKRQ